MARSYKETRGDRKVVYVVCPLCARNRVLETKDKGRLRWDFFEPGTSPLIQIREAGGKLPSEEQPTGLIKRPGRAKAIGFPITETITWHDAKTISEYYDQIEAIKAQLKRLEELE